VPQSVLFLPHVRRVTAVVLIAFAASLTFVASDAFAADDATTTGGTPAAPTSPAEPATPAAPATDVAAATPKVKKVSTRAIQKALGIKADGAMGPKTRRALKRFQKAHGLKADGVAGPATLQALGLAPAPDSRSLDSAAPQDAATVLAQIAECESGGDITAVSPDGRYHGKYQFSIATWESLGGTGDPAEADEATQDQFAAQLYAARGTAPWPTCGAEIAA
jgi:hypothetical protein